MLNHVEFQKIPKKFQIKTIYLNLLMIKSHFEFENLFSVNYTKKKTKSYIILALQIVLYVRLNWTQ